VTDEELDAFMIRVLERICALAVDTARPLIPSQTLADALAVIEGESDYQRFLSIPHYWAVYAHDGWGAFGPSKCDFLVWFRDKLDDPRTNYGQQYPVREGDIRKLTKEEFRYCLQLNAQDRAAGLRPRMVIAKFQPRVHQGVAFFSEGLAGLSSAAAPLVLEEFRALVQEVTGPDETDQATFRL
jgi:VQ motif